MVKRVADIVKNEYQEWKAGDIIFISTQTGTGKTTFILDKLLPYCAERQQIELPNEPERQNAIMQENMKEFQARKDLSNDPNMKPTMIDQFVPSRFPRKILYFVNRLALKKQIEKAINEKTAFLQDMICVETYQTLEHRILNCHNQNDWNRLLSHYNEYGYIVCDECHYFMMDSNFNTNTFLSYGWIMNMYASKVNIMMSATIKNIEKYILEDLKDTEGTIRTNIYRFPSKQNKPILHRASKQGGIYTYGDVPDYSYFTPCVIGDSNDEIIKTVLKKYKEKWLIFVDNKEFGNELKDSLETEFKKMVEGEKTQVEYTVEFLSSEYRHDPEMAKEFNHVTMMSQSSAHVLITTPLLDNGVNFEDINLKNIIVLTDTEEEFLQMVGRKRVTDQGEINLYITKRSRQHFENRNRAMREAYEIASKFYGKLLNDVKLPFSGIYATDNQHVQELNSREYSYTFTEHCNLLSTATNGQNGVSYWKSVITTFYCKDGLLILNPLSLKSLENRKAFYERMIRSFESEYGGSDTFLREELEWLGLNENDRNNFIEEANKSLCEKVCETIRRYMSGNNPAIIPNRGDSTYTAMKLKAEIKNSLRYMLDNLSGQSSDNQEIQDKCDNYKKAFAQNDRLISGPQMEFLRNHCDLPFTIDNDNGQTTITEIDLATGELVSYGNVRVGRY